MASFVSLAEVQAWFEQTKLRIDSVDAIFEETAKDLVFAKVSAAYDTTSWLDVDTTPSLIRKVMSLLIAAWTYKRAYSEDSQDTGDSYGQQLEDMANSVLAGIANGSVDLPAASNPPSSTGQPVFWPNDTTEVLNPCDAAKFEIGARF